MTLKPEDLKSCPFCGGEPDILGIGYSGQADCSDVYVKCGECDAQGPAFVVDHSEGQDEDEAATEAIAAWNRRPAPPPVTRRAGRGSAVDMPDGSHRAGVQRHGRVQLGRTGTNTK